MFAIASGRTRSGTTLFRHTVEGWLEIMHNQHPGGDYVNATVGVDHIHQMEISEYMMSIFVRSYSPSGDIRAFSHPIYSFTSIIAESGGQPYIVSKYINDEIQIHSMDGTRTPKTVYKTVGTTTADSGKCYLLGMNDRPVYEGFDGLSVVHDVDLDHSTSIWTDGAVYAMVGSWRTFETFVRRDPRAAGSETIDGYVGCIVGRAAGGVIVCDTGRDLLVYDVRACSVYDICAFDYSKVVRGTCRIL